MLPVLTFKSDGKIMRMSFQSLKLLTSVLLLAGIAGAVPITYTETTTATGTLGSDPFTLAQVILTFQSDTKNATVISSGIAYNFTGAAQVSIPSLAITANLTDPANMFALKGIIGIDENSAELISTSNTSLVAYTLRTAVGPVPGAAATTFGTPFATSQGSLIFSSVSDSIFTAAFPAAVPEPTSAALLGLGVVGVLLRLRSKRSI
jgi:hypothetical protein